VPEGVIEIGRNIATNGVPERDVPACTSCHGRLPEGDGQIYPKLKGQYANYIQYQLAAFSNGGRGHVWQGEILERDLIYSHDLPEAEALAVGAFYASVAPDETIVAGRASAPSANGGSD
jgi:cytochrome c553